jgi:hypothetical protein
VVVVSAAMTYRVCALFSAIMLAGCGGGGSGTTTTQTTSDTSGGEVADHPIRTTIPVPVPQPAVAREELSDPLQRFWTQIEETVAIRPPDAPAEATNEAVEAWANGPFAQWVTARREAMSAAITTSEEVPEDPAHERAMAAGLLGYALEDFAADVRGSPIPSDISSDPELLEVYLSSLREVLLPIANDAVVSYAFCQQRLLPLGDESEWLPWRAYCVQRGQEMIQVYELAPTDEATSPEAAAE